eukprot:GHVU01173741.1.p2 GENE.GHVU01173741.1~~GHVU01173741.1.p2  ORF type:complete len:102 (+),score=14.48 GHVU01173741.1:91-396(+)
MHMNKKDFKSAYAFIVFSILGKGVLGVGKASTGAVSSINSSSISCCPVEDVKHCVTDLLQILRINPVMELHVKSEKERLEASWVDSVDEGEIERVSQSVME